MASLETLEPELAILVKKATLFFAVWKIRGYNKSDTHFFWKAAISLPSKAESSDSLAKLADKNTEESLNEEYLVKTVK